MTRLEWTTEEQKDVLEFYGLNTLVPAEWIDCDKVNNLTGIGGVNPNKAALRGEASNEQILSSLASLDSARQLLRDDCDPLDLKDTNFMRQTLMTKMAPKMEILINSGTEAEDSTTTIELSRDASSISSSSICITKGDFDPRAFLRKVHADSSFKELVKGRQNLQKATLQRNESLKNLVKQNFDRFVNAKNATELVFKDMQQRRLVESDHGMKRAFEALTSAHQKTQEVFGQLMKQRDKEQNIRRKLEIFERYDFILSLGHRLEQAIKIGEYQSAVSDYRKAKEILSDASMTTSHTLRSILDKIWLGHVEKTLSALRKDLCGKLRNTVFSFEVHARLIRILIDLDAKPDPIYGFFSTRQTDFFDSCRSSTEHALEELNKITVLVDQNLVPRLILELVQNHQMHRFGSLQLGVVKSWKIRGSLIRMLADSYQQFYSDFGKFINALLSGRFVRGGGAGGSKDVKFAITEYEKNIKEEYIETFISKFPKYLESVISFDLYEQTKVRENSAITAHYCSKYSAELCQVILVTINARAPDFVFSAVVDSIKRVLCSLILAIWTHAKNDCRQLSSYETWKWSGEGFDMSTILIKGFESLLVHLIYSTGDIIENFESVIQGESDLSNNLDMQVAESIVTFLDSLLLEATKEQGRIKPETMLSTVDNLCDNVQLDDLGISYRILTILTNLIYLREAAIPHILSLFPASDKAKSTINTRLNNVDIKLKRAFLDRKRSRLITLIQANTINSDFDWNSIRTSVTNTTSSPLAIRPYVLAILLELVSIQTQIYDVSSKVLKSLMVELVMDIFQEYLKCFQMIRHFSYDGYLQARSELAMLQQKLITIMSEDAMQVYNNAMLTLDACCLSIDENSTKKLLDQALLAVSRNTEMSFTCFQYS